MKTEIINQKTKKTQITKIKIKKTERKEPKHENKQKQ